MKRTGKTSTSRRPASNGVATSPSPSQALPRTTASKRPTTGPAPIDCGNGVTLVRDVPFRLSDGTVLRSDHYLPPGGGRSPTLLVRQPYGKDIATTVVYAHPVWFARHGYNVVIQDVRGRGVSTGEFHVFRNEEQDGFETVEWLASRPECNGRIGMYGFSYQGVTQLLAAARRPKALQCIAPWMTAGDLYHGWFYHHGMLRLAAAIGWGTQMLRGDAHRQGLSRTAAALDSAWANLAPHFHAAPFSRIPHLTAPGLPTYYRDWIRNDRPSRYWSDLDLSRRWDAIDIPVLHLGGWYDLYLHGSIDLFEKLSQHAATPETRSNQYLVVGPWVHIPWGNWVGEADLGPAALVDTDALLLRWFNHWLKDSGEFASEPKLRLFALGSNQWHTPATWHGLQPGPTKLFHLRSGGRANSIRGDGRLSLTAPDTDEPRDTFVHDPEVPVPAPGGFGAPQGCFSQNRLELGNNVLLYTSEPLTTALHICGAPRVRIAFQSSLDHTDLIVKLVRVTPDGRATNVVIGGARSSFLFPDFRADTVRTWEFDLEPTSCVFAAGDRLRLEVSSSAFPLYDRNPGTGKPSRDARPSDWKRARQQVLHSAAFPSTLELPLLP